MSIEINCPNCGVTIDARIEFSCPRCGIATAVSHPERTLAPAESEVVKNGARWATNIVVELLHNYGEKVPAQKRELLRTAAAALQEFSAP